MSNEKKQNIDKLLIALDICTGNTDGHAWMRVPFSVGKLNIATDGHIIAAIPGKKLFSESVVPANAEKAAAWALATKEDAALKPCAGTLTAAEILDADAAWPMTNKCRECEGKGEVLCECTCGDEHTRPCMDCEGTGKERGSHRDDQEHVLLEGIAHFGVQTWGKLAEVVRTTGIEGFIITHGSERNLLRLVATNAPLLLCIMPALPDDNREPFRTLCVSEQKGSQLEPQPT